MNETAANFEGTKDAGEECERRVAAWLKSLGASDIRIVGHTGTKDWDIVSSFGTYEVKRDFRSILTGNHFLEYQYNGEPSGLNVTKADFFVIVVPDRLKVMPTREIREFIDRHDGAFRFVETAGDDGRAGGFVVPKRYFAGSYLVGYDEVPLHPPIPHDPGMRRFRA